MEQIVPMVCQMEIDVRKMEITIQKTRLLLSCLALTILAQLLLMEITRLTVMKMKSFQFRNAQRILPKTDDQLHIPWHHVYHVPSVEHNAAISIQHQQHQSYYV
jgi:hypothetical protein